MLPDRQQQRFNVGVLYDVVMWTLLVKVRMAKIQYLVTLTSCQCSGVSKCGSASNGFCWQSRVARRSVGIENTSQLLTCTGTLTRLGQGFANSGNQISNHSDCSSRVLTRRGLNLEHLILESNLIVSHLLVVGYSRSFSLFCLEES